MTGDLIFQIQTHMSNFFFFRSKCRLFPNRDISWYIDFIICGYGKVTDCFCGYTELISLKMKHYQFEDFPHRNPTKRGDVHFVSADGQLDAVESSCVSDLSASSMFCGSPESFLPTDKTHLTHPSGRLNT